MRLGEKDLQQFLKLHKSLMLYVNQRLKILREVKTLEDLRRVELDKVIKIRDEIYTHPELIDEFIEDNPLHFKDKELRLIREWKTPIKGNFYMVKYLKNYSVFLDDEIPAKAYGVLALTDTFEEILGPELPIRLEAVLLPFKEQIVYDGFLRYSNIIFGRGFSGELNEEYHQAKDLYGIITNLPWKAEKPSDADRLKFYMKSRKNMLRYEMEIDELLDKIPELITDYHQHLGRINSRKIRKQLGELDVKDAWFAVFRETAITNGETKKQVEDNLKKLLSEEKREFPYIFHYKKKK
jgi:hypothetical protein